MSVADRQTPDALKAVAESVAPLEQEMREGLQREGGGGGLP